MRPEKENQPRKRTPLKVRRRERAAVRATKARVADSPAWTHELRNRVLVNIDKLAPDNSYDLPEFKMRGYYLDKPFTCQDCGKPEVWTATQQKWWYEVARGEIHSVASRCRACRRKERERRAISQAHTAQRAQNKGAKLLRRGLIRKTVRT